MTENWTMFNPDIPNLIYLIQTLILFVSIFLIIQVFFTTKHWLLIISFTLLLISNATLNFLLFEFAEIVRSNRPISQIDFYQTGFIFPMIGFVISFFGFKKTKISPKSELLDS